MHPRLEELFGHLAHHRAELCAALDAVPPDARERRPAPERWSVAEVLEHLVIIETRVTQRLTAVLDAARAEGLGPDPDTAPIMPTVDMVLLLDRTRRITAPVPLHPRGNLSAAAAWPALEASRERFLAVMRAGDGLALGTIVMTHPVLGELTLYQWIGTVAGHEARHAAQIREITRELGVGA